MSDAREPEPPISDPPIPQPPPRGPLAVFPLTGSLLLPGTFLPLNVFEPRYRHMVEDALGDDGRIGMIQPWIPQPDNWAPPADPERPELYAVGCQGWLERCEPQPDGRYHILLRGLCRFRVEGELDDRRGYRRVDADSREFLADLTRPADAIGPGRLLAAVDRLQEQGTLEFDRDVLAALPGVTLLNALSAALPFAPAEKQALLEAGTPEEREELLLALLGMGFEELAAEEGYAPPVVN